MFALLFLHVATLFGAVAIHSGGMWLTIVAARGGDPSAAEGVARTFDRAARFVPIGFVVGGVFGLLTALTFGYDLRAPWLLIAYALFVVAAILGARFSVPAVVAAGRDASTSHETAVMDGATRLAALDSLVIALLIADMVIKPLS